MSVLKDDNYYRGFRDRRQLKKFSQPIIATDAPQEAYRSYREGWADGILPQLQERPDDQAQIEGA